MSFLVGEYQSSFILGRQSIDNVIIVQEALHSMRRKVGKKGWMIFKLDLEKAYDGIHWPFHHQVLQPIG